MSGPLTIGRFRVPYLAAALLIAALQIGILGSMVLKRAAILADGAEVLLRTAPVDPRDLMRGDYVILSYDISSIPADLLKGGMPDSEDLYTAYVRLKPGEDGFWAATEASVDTPLAPVDGSVVIRSRPAKLSRTLRNAPNGERFRLKYGIERFYVPEGQGKPLEAARGERTLSVAVRVADDGTAQIRRIMIDGAPVFEEPLY